MIHRHRDSISHKVSLYIYYLVIVLIKLNNMLPKAPVITLLTAATTLGLGGDTSIKDTNSQLVTVG